MSNRVAAMDVLESALVWDNHTCMPLRADDHSFLPQLDRLRSTGVDVVTLNVGMDMNTRDLHFAMLDSFSNWVEANSGDYLIARNCGDIELARNSDRLAIVFDIEGMALIGDELALIGELRRRGVFWMLVAYNRNNSAGGGCMDDDPGLSDHGRAIIAEMKRVGLVVCCSHTGHRTALDVIESADNPVIFSHSNASSVFEHLRNIPDALIRACAETGGVVGINGLGDFLGAGTDYADSMIRHIDHIVQLVGPEHVGISLDFVFDGGDVSELLANKGDYFGEGLGIQYTDRFAPPEVFLDVVGGLLRLGYGIDDIQKIIGGNWMRIATEVWQ